MHATGTRRRVDEGAYNILKAIKRGKHLLLL
jgi:hypothetical protein